jgi:hypothetical protein
MSDYQQLGLSPEPPTKAWKRGATSAAKVRIVERTLEHIESVPYRVSLRWLFYRLLQEGELAGKDSYKQFVGTIAKARHSGLIHPYAIADEGRDQIATSGKWNSVDAFRDWLVKEWRNGYRASDLMGYHNPYVIVAFEAKAMASQFVEYATPYHVRLWPFGGDPSIPYKYELASLIQELKRSVTLLYFGDLDAKGEAIGESAMRDVRKWAGRDFHAYHVALTSAQAAEYELPENPERPGQFQWEALSDAQAREIIEGSLDEFVDLEIIEELEAQQAAELAALADRLGNSFGERTSDG